LGAKKMPIGSVMMSCVEVIDALADQISGPRPAKISPARARDWMIRSQIRTVRRLRSAKEMTPRSFASAGPRRPNRRCPRRACVSSAITRVAVSLAGAASWR